MFQFITRRTGDFVAATILFLTVATLLVVCFIVGSQPPVTVTLPPSTSDHVATLADSPTGCANQGDLECATDMKDLLAKDAFNAYANGSELSYKETLTGYAMTYLRTISASEKYDPATEIAIPSQVFPHTFHVFRISK
jgi:hypothetical protein